MNILKHLNLTNGFIKEKNTGAVLWLMKSSCCSLRHVLSSGH